MIVLRFDRSSAVPPYLQLVQQVRRAMRLGLLDEGDQLPTVKDVVAKVAINPNTVLKAYRELELAGVVEARAGRGTVVRQPARRQLANQSALERELSAWVRRAHTAGWDREDMVALIEETLRAAFRDAGREDMA